MRRLTWSVIVLSLLLSACGGMGGVKPERKPAPVAPGDTAPRSKYGNPESYEVAGETYHVLPTARGYHESGTASWYGEEFHGRRTSSGEPYNMHAMTAAHRTLPLPTYVRVTNLDNKRQVIVRVNDRGPFHSDRLIDLSFAAASELGVLRNGTARVEVVAVDPVSAAASLTPANTVSAAKPGRSSTTANSAASTRTDLPAEAASDVLAPDEIPVSVRHGESPDDQGSIMIRELPADPSLPATSPPPLQTVATANLKTRIASGHYLQAGAFSMARNADALIERLRQAGFTNVGLYPAGGILKVRLGPYPSVSALLPDRDRLGELGIRAYQIEE